MSFLLSLLALLLLPALLSAQTDSVPKGMARYVNVIDSIHTSLRDRFVPFRFDYPAEWSSRTSMENPTNFIQVNSPRSLTAITTSGELFCVGPLGMEGSPTLTEEQRTSEARELLVLMEPQISAGFARFRHDTVTAGTVDGLEGVQLLFTAQPTWKGNIPAGRVFGRLLVVPPGEMHAGFLVLMMGDSGLNDVTSSDRMGTRGRLGEIMNSFRVTREKQVRKTAERIVPLPAEGETGISHYRQTRDLLPEGLASAYVPFGFDYPRRWRVTPGKLLGNTYVKVERIIEARGEEDFVAEGLSVGSVVFGYTSDSARRAITIQVAGIVESQIGRTFTDYRRASIGPVVIGGVDGYEVRGSGHTTDARFSDVTNYIRLIVLPPTTKRPGLLLGLTSCSLVDGVTGAEMVGESGELGEILRSFRVMEE